MNAARSALEGIAELSCVAIDTVGRTERHPALLWVRSGLARVELPQLARTVAPGQAVWIPAGMEYRLHLGPNTVVVPVSEPEASVAEASVVDVSDALGDWLIWRFTRSLGFLAPPASNEPALDLVAAGAATHSGSSVAAPPMPRSAVAVQIARECLRNPASSLSLTEVATGHAVSVRRVQQIFAAETGISFGRWRTRVRLAAAADLLGRGHDVLWTAQKVGFGSAAGFSRAFAARVGETPGAYARRSRSSPHRRPVATLSADHASHAVPGGPTDTPPPIPSMSSWERINGFHVLVWVYRGSATVTVGGVRVPLNRGDALWLPPAVRNRVELPEGSILLPLGSVPGNSGTLAPPPRPLSFPTSAVAEGFLLHHAVANYSWIRSRGHDAFRVTRLFLSAFQQSAGLSEPSPVAGAAASVAQALRSDPTVNLTLSEWARELSVEPRRLREEFVREFGQPFPAWRQRVRMTRARQFLEEGMPVREVARRVGYAHPPACTRAFTRVHGTNPRSYRDAALRSADELIVR